MADIKTMKGWRLGGQVICLAVCYYGAEQLGLWQAIPPGFATAISPAYAIALVAVLLFGYRISPGVLIGSFLVNVRTTYDPDHLAVSLLLPLGIGIGAALQAIVGAVLMRRLIGFPNPLNNEHDVAKFFLVIAPLSCVIHATIGTLLLWRAGRLPWDELPFQWWTWWVGDTMGAFVVAPLILVWTAPSRTQRSSRPITVTVPLGILAALVVMLFVYTNHRERERTNAAFELQTVTLTRALEGRLDYVFEALYAMRNDHGHLPSEVDELKFTRSAQALLSRRATVDALSWLPRIKDSERDAFEVAGRALRGDDFCIKQFEQGDFVCARRRAEYFPVVYREPGGMRGMGFDVASERRQVLMDGIDSGGPVASPPVAPLQNPSGPKTVLIYLSVYRDGIVPDDVEQRRRAITGYVVAVLQVDRLVGRAWENFDTDGIDITIDDETTTPPQQLLQIGGRSISVSQAEIAATDTHRFQPAVPMEAAGRRWMLHFVQTPEYLTAHRSLQAWSVLAGGMLFTGMLGGVLLVVTGRASLVASLVEERTAELAQANAGLTREIEIRQRAEAELKQAEERMRRLLESAPDPMVIVNDGGRIEFVNSQLEKVFDYGRAELLGQDAEILVPDRFHTGHPLFRTEFFKDPHSRPLGLGTNLYGRRKNGDEFPVEISLSPLNTPDGVLVTATIRDVTERQRVAAALEESRRLVEQIAEMVPTVLYVYDLKSERDVFVNTRMSAFLGYSAEEIKQKGSALLREHAHPDDRYQLDLAAEQIQLAEDQTVIEFESRVRHANGEWRWLHTCNTMFRRDEDGSPRQILGTAQDITERKRLEQEVLEIAAQEQRRIGQELHDGTGQELTGLCMLADNLADAAREDAPHQAQRAARIAQGLKHALGQVRALSRGLIPVEVDAEGLMSALEDLAGRIRDIHHVNCVFECVAPVPVENNFTATQLYRIAQEAITNALKHGKAPNIRVSLDAKGAYLTLKITDDGVGIGAMENATEGMGLRIMRYRAGQIGAQFSVRPGPSGGTVVTCSLFRGTPND
jgi:PAS domain S-box-containing protein